jgi:hypothetical protein
MDNVHNLIVILIYNRYKPTDRTLMWNIKIYANSPSIHVIKNVKVKSENSCDLENVGNRFCNFKSYYYPVKLCSVIVMRFVFTPLQSSDWLHTEITLINCTACQIQCGERFSKKPVDLNKSCASTKLLNLQQNVYEHIANKKVPYIRPYSERRRNAGI